MTKLTYSTPSVGEKVTVAEPLVDTALAQIKTVVNGELNSENLKAGGVAKGDLSAEVQAELASFVGLPLEAKKSIIATEQERESVTYGTLSTPDEVEVTLGTNGLLVVGYRANWVAPSGSGRAAIFLSGVQLKNPSGTAFLEAETSGTLETTLESTTEGLVSGVVPANAPATTGQTLGHGSCLIFAAAGTYKVSIRFKAPSGKVKVNSRKLWAYVIG